MSETNATSKQQYFALEVLISLSRTNWYFDINYIMQIFYNNKKTTNWKFIEIAYFDVNILVNILV